MRNLAGKRALITGAGHGLGRELSRVFAIAGAEVIVTDREPDLINETTRMVRELGGWAEGYPMDVTDEQSVRSVHDRISSKHGPIDLLINNAGIVHGGAFLDVPLDRHLETYRVNAGGIVIVTHVFLPDLIARPEGHLVNIASASGLIGLPYAATYASSKWAVIGFSDSIREELLLAGHRHVQVTTICPGYIRTGMFEGVRSPRFVRMLTSQDVAQQVLRAVRCNREQVLSPWLVKLIPLGRGTMLRSWFRGLCHWLGVTTGAVTWHGYGNSHPERRPPMQNGYRDKDGQSSPAGHLKMRSVPEPNVSYKADPGRSEIS